MDLINDLRKILSNGNSNSLPSQFRNLAPSHIKKLSNSEIKGILFAYHSNRGDRTSYNTINERAIRYKNKLRDGISEEGFTIREQLLEKEMSLQDKNLDPEESIEDSWLIWLKTSYLHVFTIYVITVIIHLVYG